MLKNKIIIFSLFILIIFGISTVSASENLDGVLISDLGNSATDINNPINDEINVYENTSLAISNKNMELSSLDDDSDKSFYSDNDVIINDSDNSNKTSKNQFKTMIKAKNVNSYYKENLKLVLSLVDSDNQAIPNKAIKITINGKIYSKLTDNSGKVELGLKNLKPKTYLGKMEFLGDEDYKSCSSTVKINIRKSPLSIKVSDYKTYFLSDLFFSAKVINKITKNPIEGIKVMFNVYSSQNKYKNYYAKTDKNGIARLSKNLKVGSYDVYTYIKDNAQKNFINYRNLKNKVVLTIKKTAEVGCSSIYLRKNENESAVAFRRDSTYAATLYIVAQKWHGRTAVKQYKLTGTYFFHAITTSDGWMMGTGGWDNPSVNRNIENLAGQIVSSNAIKTSLLNKIKYYERKLPTGHFAIVAPDGRYAVLWKSGYIRGTLKNGEYLDVPNARSLFRHGTYKKFSTNVPTAAMRIAATDVFGVNRRNIMTYHYKRVTKNYKTSAQVAVYGTNDKGNLMGRHTVSLRDNVYYKKTYYSKYKLPGSPNKKLLGTHSFGNIDKLIKTQTTLSAPKVTNDYNVSKYFCITLKNKKTKNVLKGVKINVKVYTDSKYKNYVITTNRSGVAHFNTKVLDPGTHSVVISPANHKYIISGKGTIVIKKPKVNPSNSSDKNQSAPLNDSSRGDNSTDLGGSVSGSVGDNSTDLDGSVNESTDFNSIELENSTNEDIDKDKTNLSSINENILLNLLFTLPKKIFVD